MLMLFVCRRHSRNQCADWIGDLYPHDIYLFGFDCRRILSLQQNTVSILLQLFRVTVTCDTLALDIDTPHSG